MHSHFPLEPQIWFEGQLDLQPCLVHFSQPAQHVARRSPLGPMNGQAFCEPFGQAHVLLTHAASPSQQWFPQSGLPSGQEHTPCKQLNPSGQSETHPCVPRHRSHSLQHRPLHEFAPPGQGPACADETPIEVRSPVATPPSAARRKPLRVAVTASLRARSSKCCPSTTHLFLEAAVFPGRAGSYARHRKR
jgi:hypothetical protein